MTLSMKRIEAPTLAKALAKVESECGKDALLVETKPTSKGYVVLAAPQAEASTPTVTIPRPAAPAGKRPGVVQRLLGVREWTRGFGPLAEQAMDFGLSPKLLRVVEDALLGTKVALDREGDPALPLLAGRILKALIRTRPELEGRVHALIGPTGVGKTTTIAKLAAKAVRENLESVAILSLDTYRIAAVEQLRAYADMLGVPFQVVFTPLDLRRALAEHEDKDRVFIDTTGRGPLDDKALRTMRGALDIDGVRTCLCLPAGMRRRDAELATKAFGTLDPGHLILTKWDETVVPGEVLSLAVERDMLLSHITVGQEVPDDIIDADPGVLAANALDLSDTDAEQIL